MSMIFPAVVLCSFRHVELGLVRLLPFREKVDSTTGDVIWTNDSRLDGEFLLGERDVVSVEGAASGVGIVSNVIKVRLRRLLMISSPVALAWPSVNFRFDEKAILAELWLWGRCAN